MNKIKNLFLLFEIILVFSPVSVIYAETRIDAAVLTNDAVWDKINSPYILSSEMIVPSGVTLTIGPGVKVLKDPSTEYTGLYIEGGSLIIGGKGSSRVIIDGIWGISVWNGTASIANTDIVNINAFGIENSNVNMATTTISKSSTPLDIKNSVVKVWGSRFTENRYGINIRPQGNAFLMMNEDGANNIGGIGNALDDGPIIPTLTINNSVIANNIYEGIVNSSFDTISAIDNWWGSADGPVKTGVNKISGLIDYEPWLLTEPVLDPGKDEDELVCCSSILFLPGFEGSSLYKLESLPLGLGNTENTLWPPNRNDDARKLFLNTDGGSMDPTIYSGSPISSVFSLYGIYGKFMGFLDSLTQNGTVNEWKSFAYDWRKPIAEVVAGPERKATTTEYLIHDIEELASRSRTGKVTLIAHSNGGLVAKYLVKALEETGKSNLIDSVISVAVPYLGTPQAIASVLHGDGQSIGFGTIVKQAVARELGLNMPSAYSLLPSAKYFSQMLIPSIVFASSSVVGVNNGSYPINIQSGSDQLAFITDLNNTRTQPDLSNIDLPIIGNNILSVAADVLHSILDPYSWPTNIVRWAIVGWNANTMKSVNYRTEIECKKSPSLPSCISFLTHNASTTQMGDGTVVAKSAAYEAGKVASVDLNEVSSNDRLDVTHANILESSTTQTTIEGIIKHNRNSEPFPLPAGVSWGEPDYSKDIPETELVISTHSPVELHVYDDKGNHTGIIPNPTGEDIEEGLFTFFEAKIPGSRFSKQDKNEGESDNYVTVPDNGKKYSIVVRGTGVGDFTLEIERQKGGAVLDHVEYNGLPVTPLTVATTSVMVAPFESLQVSNLASSSKPLEIDVDGNGSPDIQATSGIDYLTADFDWVNYLEILKKTITSLLGNTNKANNLNKRIDKLENLVKKSKAKQTQNLAKRLEKRFGHMKLKGLNEADKQQIVDMIDTFIAQYE